MYKEIGDEGVSTRAKGKRAQMEAEAARAKAELAKQREEAAAQVCVPVGVRVWGGGQPFDGAPDGCCCLLRQHRRGVLSAGALLH